MLALRLLRPFSEWISQIPVNLGIAKIYLDTMSVWPIAEKLRQFHSNRNSNTIDYQIESFRSYDGLPTWQPIRFPSFVIISASTSDGLADSVSDRLGKGNAEIWTIVLLSSVSNENSDERIQKKCAARIPRTLTGNPTINGLRSVFEPNILSIPPGSETISIVGERFLSQPARPKRVRLVHTKLDDSVKRDLSWLAKNKLVKIGRGRFDGQSRWTVSFDIEKLIDLTCEPQLAGVETLLKRWLKNYSAPSPVLIIYPSTEGTSAIEVGKSSMRFAKLTQSTLKELSPEANVFLISSDELARDFKELPDLRKCSVIITSPITGNGFSFKQISALLRLKQPTGPRLFLTLAVLSDSSNSLSQLNSDVARVATVDARYDLKYKLAFSIGRLDSVFGWELEVQVLRALDDRIKADERPTWLDSRIDELETLDLTKDTQVFLPSFIGAPLPLSTGFFLWTESSEIEGNDLAPAVLLTIAALLESARTSTSKVNETSLRSGIFQHALICPDTFTRFNDPVIQAAILRAAYPAELNYAVSPEMSNDMAKLALKWLRYYEDSAGAAVPEFLMAIAIGKLKLARHDMKNVLSYAKTHCRGWVRELAVSAETPIAYT
jgi:hypothetical protein